MIINLHKDHEVSAAQMASIRKDLEGQVTMMLTMCGTPIKYRGFHFLKEALIVTAIEPNMVFMTTKIIYPTIADKFQVSAASVERNIRFAMYVAVHSGKFETLNKYFGYKVFENNQNVTNNEFIATMANFLYSAYTRPVIE